ncbi:uncharacterized protein B0H18DRAFT_850728, partial [Fomitopsis serialis]|uniref:uncharacterized protein n=1 Tax=Fomitopsis serialis TaxID=139415 RepID=UPI0020073A24
ANEAQAIQQLPKGRRPYSEPVVKQSIGAMNIECPNCKALHFKGEKLSNSSLIHPKFGICCLQGQVQLDPPTIPPLPLQRLFNGVDNRSAHFLKNIRRYNAAFAFTSVAVNIDQAVLMGSGPYSFRIHGDLYHLMGSLMPQDGSRLANNPENNNRDQAVMASVMSDIQDALMQVNPLIPLYKQAYQIIREKPANEQVHVEAHIILEASADKRRYNLPTIEEVAAVIPGSGDEDIDKHRDIVLRLQGGGLKRVSNLHPLYLPLHYVMLFPRGDQGWHMNIPSIPGPDNRVRSANVSQRCYFAYRIHP